MDDYSKLANLPAATPPPGVVLNFNNPPSRAHEMYTGLGICLAVSTFFLALRMYAKFMVTHSLGWDDCETHPSIIIRKLTAIVACSIGFVRNPSLPAYSCDLHYDIGVVYPLRDTNVCQ